MPSNRQRHLTDSTDPEFSQNDLHGLLLISPEADIFKQVATLRRLDTQINEG